MSGGDHIVPADTVLLCAKCDTQQAYISTGDLRTLHEGKWLNDQVHYYYIQEQVAVVIHHALEQNR